MVETFIVRETLKMSDFGMPFRAGSSAVVLVLDTTCIVLTIAILVKAPSSFSYWTMMPAFSIVVAWLSSWIVFRRPRTKEATVKIFPFAIQLSSTSTPARHQARTVLLRQDVVDCVINEVILAHRVVSIILFRIRDAKGVVQLVQAFPGIELHYRDALRIRNDMFHAINLPVTSSN